MVERVGQILELIGKEIDEERESPKLLLVEMAKASNGSSN